MLARVMAFIDGSNLFYSAKDEDLRIDFRSFRDLLADPTIYGEEIRFIRPYYYGSTAGYQPQDSFHQRLMQMGYDTRILPLRQKGDLRIEKGVDVWLAVDMVNFAARGQYDIAVLVSGDSDYLPACRMVKDWGKTLFLVTFERSCAQELRLVADAFIDLTSRAPQLKR
ncbi:MAG: NYN domain-containing protein [Thermoplasmata archaeon]|nr:NYN domain-containing protein [Thermoplasmata archaeon]